MSKSPPWAALALAALVIIAVTPAWLAIVAVIVAALGIEGHAAYRRAHRSVAIRRERS